jgi:hypothetical protein
MAVCHPQGRHPQGLTWEASVAANALIAGVLPAVQNAKKDAEGGADTFTFTKADSH